MSAAARSRRRWWLGLAGLALVAVIGISWGLGFRDRATPVTQAGVVEALTAAPAGVFRYHTSGFEEIDALAGARHDYPAETFITVRPEGCGIRMRWDVLEERWSEWELCREGRALLLATFSSFHKWFGRTDHETYACADRGAVVPSDLSVGSAWTTACSTDERSTSYRREVVGLETVLVDGNEVETIHVRTSSSLSGGTTGGAVEDSWWALEQPLLVRRMVDNASTTDTVIGDVNYHERYEIRLSSLEPVAAVAP